MNTSQKKVALGAFSGIVGMIVLVYVLYRYLPEVNSVQSLIDRIVFTLKMNVIAVIPFFVMMVFVGNGRFLSDAIDPTKHMESKELEINARVANNTLEQNFVFFVSTLALCTFLSSESIKLVSALAIVFVVARISFWVGYRINPLYRAPGMAATSYMNLGIILVVIYNTINYLN